MNKQSCKHEKVDTNILHKESVGTCNCCGEIIIMIKVDSAEYKRLREFYEKYKSLVEDEMT